MDNGHARERVGGFAASSGAVCGWAGEADSSDAGEGEEVRPVRLLVVTNEATRAVMLHTCREAVPWCWTNGTTAKTGLAIDELKRRMSTSAWLLGIEKVKQAEGERGVDESGQYDFIIRLTMISRNASIRSVKSHPHLPYQGLYFYFY